jgi:NAD-dependent deacetylase
MDDEELRFAAGSIADADTALAMSGAGVSTASGLPDFRSANGLWERYDPDDFHISRFRSDPKEFWTTYVQIAEELHGEGVDPNPAHTSLAALEQNGHIEAIITQNVDGLHQDAGSENVVELHGNGQRVVCPECHTKYDTETIIERINNGDMPPRCEQCNSVLKPDVVLFGEQLPEHAFYRAHAISQRCDTFLVVGSSLTVEPAAGLPEMAANRGATLIIVTHDRTPLSDRAEYDFRADVTDVLPRLREDINEYEF